MPSSMGEVYPFLKELRTLATLTKDQSLNPAPMWWFMTVCTPVQGGWSIVFLTSLNTGSVCYVHTCRQNTHTYKLKHL